MDRKAAVIRTRFPEGGRVLAISDIHGNLPFLQGLLEQAGYTARDILILVGDLVEKGPDSLAVLRYVMELSKKRTVYALRGNCDNLVAGLLRMEWSPAPAFFAQYLDTWRDRSLLVQLGRAAGFELRAPEDLPALSRTVAERLPEELAFLLSMPDILVTPDYLFVHGGVPSEEGLGDLTAHSCLKNDNFLAQGHFFRRWCVVGHWPVTLYNPVIPAAAPLLDRARHIVCIDGGCVLKLDGQLNALIIPDVFGEEMDYTWYDGLPAAVALDPQEPSADPLNIRWSDSLVEVLEEEGDCVRVLHPATGRTMWLPLDFISVRRDGRTHTEDASDYALPVAPGDRLSLVRQTRRGLLVKKDGITGWYYGRIKYDKE